MNNPYLKANKNNVIVGMKLVRDTRNMQNKVIYQVIRIIPNRELESFGQIDVEVKRIDGKLISGKVTEIRSTGWFHIINSNENNIEVTEAITEGIYSSEIDGI